MFDFVVINGVRKPDPQARRFLLRIADSPTADSSMLPPRMAVKPDKVLLNYEKIIEDKQGQKQANSFLGILEAGVGAFVHHSGSNRHGKSCILG